MTQRRAGALVAAFAALLGAGALIAALAAFASPQTQAAATFTDRTGDATPDITIVSVRHDGNGVVTLAVTAVGMGTPPTQGDWQGIWVYLEPDDDTSSVAAAPYSLTFEDWTTGTACQLTKDNGTSYMPVPSTVTCARSGETVSWTFAKSDIGAPHELFSFFVVAWHGTLAGQVLGQDRGPDFGRWGYYFDTTTTSTTTTAAPPPVPVIGKPSVTPSRPVAGKSFAVTFAVRRRDNGAPLTAGTVRCDPTIAGRLVAHREQFKSGKARISIRLPANASGKTLKVQLTVTSNGHSATRTAAFRVAAQ